MKVQRWLPVVVALAILCIAAFPTDVTKVWMGWGQSASVNATAIAIGTSTPVLLVAGDPTRISWDAYCSATLNCEPAQDKYTASPAVTPSATIGMPIPGSTLVTERITPQLGEWCTSQSGTSNCWVMSHN